MPAKKLTIESKKSGSGDAKVTPKQSKSLGRSTKDFTVRELHEHIMESPDMFIGSTRKRMTDEWIYDFETQRMKKVQMDLPDGVKRVFLEILTNAGDNSFYSMYNGVDPGPVCFEFSSDGYLSITNGGLPMPVEPHTTTTKDKLIYVPQSAFGVLMSSTNYDKSTERLGCGRNGFGSKLTNIYSKHFIAEVGDSGRLDENGEAISGQLYKGEWKNNMFDVVKSEAKPGYVQDSDEPNNHGWRRRQSNEYTGKSFVKIEWLLDFERFGMTDAETEAEGQSEGRGKEGGYNDNELCLFARYVLEVSLSCQIPVKINGQSYDFRDIRKFASLFWDSSIVSRAVSQFCWPKGEDVPEEFLEAKPPQREKLALEPKYSRQIESRTLILDTPDSKEVLSYANGMNTIEGGVHVEAIYKKLCPTIAEFGTDGFKRTKKEKVQSKAARRAAKSGIKKGMMRTKGKKGDDDKDTPKVEIKPADIKPHLSIVTVCRVFDPEWDSQSKKKLDAPAPAVKLDEYIFDKILGSTWHLTDRLRNAIGAKTLKALRDSNGSRGGHVDLGKKGEDANKAGTKDSAKCGLFLCEGKSASSYPFLRIGHLPGGKNLWGYFCLKGKPMNVSANNLLDIAGYEEFNILKELLNLHEEKDYSTPESRKDLRYGKVILATDADVDGAHISGLVINFFHRRWPSLLECGYLQQLVTPIVKATPKDLKLPQIRFYDEADFAAWTCSAEGKAFKGKIKYYKGLGSSKPEEVKDDVKIVPTVTFVYDPDAPDAVEMAFNPKYTDKRKLWIGRWRTIRETAPVFKPVGLEVDRKISEIINFTLTPYTIENLFRSIASFKDGLKKAQRQAIYHSLKHWGFSAAGEKKEIKVGRLGTAACEKTQYHHGEKSMQETIMHLAADYIGTNNLSFYQQEGNFGTRSKGGEDRADPRYPGVLPAWWIQHVFQKEMIDLVELREVDGEFGEPNWIPCDIPLGIINGCRGLATGWSTNIPPHHPIDVIDWVLDKIEGTRTPDPLMPFYRGFRGITEIFSSKTDKEEEIHDEFKAQDAEFSDNDSERSEDGDDDTERAIEQMLQSSQRTKGRSVITTGTFNIIATNDKENTVDVLVTEIPVGRYNLSYIKWAKDLVAAGKIRSAVDVGKDPYLQMTLTGVPKDMANPTKLGLVKSYGMSNLVMIDDDGIPQPYKSVEHILSKYVRNMLGMYSKLKTKQLDDLKAEEKFLNAKLKIIKAVKSKSLEFVDIDDEIVFAKLDELGLDKKVFVELPSKSYMKADPASIENKISETIKEYNRIDNIPSADMWIERLLKFRKLLEKKYPAPLVPEPSESKTMVLDGETVYHTAVMNCEQ